MKEGFAISEPPFTLKVFTSCYWGKEVLERIMLVLEKYLNHVHEHFLYLVMTSAKNFKT